ncbi:Na+/H+ antiporter [Labilithrix luteola]|uniref:Na+/H+ antiporter n=1 Tax=Labilithrix luteola TaxID=1391654 RepID=A0A0K1PTV0_9BACT|nr:cation:proton antiporter [Labilithrix luteola]AKU96960.1 Na+/H+ antiporter [Labilithrix luteola]
MVLFESTLALLLVAVVLLQISRRLHVPYPVTLALAGAGVAAIPGAPAIVMEPHLALALFISPPLLDAAYDLPPRELRRNWIPLLALVVFAVVITTITVALTAYTWAGLPIAAAITLGAIVAPPDAAAATAMLSGFDVSRRTLAIVQGESLLNDAVALLIFGVSVTMAMSHDATVAAAFPRFLVAVPGGVVLGLVLATLYLRARLTIAGTLGGTISEFVSAFGVWIVAERLHLSPILAIVAFAMKIAHWAPSRMSARDRVRSYAVWETVVFVLNVLAFLLMGLQARIILTRLHGGSELREALVFAGVVLVVVILTRIVWVLISGRLVHDLLLYLLQKPHRAANVPAPSELFVVSWTGMRGLVTLATSFALPANFPKRDLIVLTAFVVVIGSLVIHGLTLGPLLRFLGVEPDTSFARELSFARATMIDAALASLAEHHGKAADAVRAEYQAARQSARCSDNPQAETAQDRLRMQAIAAERAAIAKLRHEGRIGDDVFHQLEEELDWSELNAAPPGYFLVES